ncbi:MAG: hypothetical protein J6X59_07320 [Bacteroidales bacterium]|nr:hypothetical protein [Bacteroidales bacterium]
MKQVHNCPELMEAIGEMGFLPLLGGDIEGFSADELVAPECRYVALPDGGWDWPLWDWKGPIVTEGHFAYGKFFGGKAGFVSMDWWPDLCNYRRHKYPEPAEDSIEGTILEILRVNGSMITRDLRSACGFDSIRSAGSTSVAHAPNMRSRFDGYVTRLQMACRIVTEDFVYPTDKHGNRYGWGWALLTTPEHLFSPAACQCPRTPEESLHRLCVHLHSLLPEASEKQILKLIA